MSFFDWDGSQARSDINKSYASSNKALKTGFDTSQGYYDKASSSFDPFVSAGAAGEKMYGDLLGINGTDARDAAQGIVTSDPLWSGKLSADTNAVLRNLNARGTGASGAAALAGQRVLAQNYDNVLSRYAGLGNQGLSATGQKAGVLTGQGDNAYGYGATKAANSINYGNAMAQTRNAGLNNILNIIGTGAKAVTAYNGIK